MAPLSLSLPAVAMSSPVQATCVAPRKLAACCVFQGALPMGDEKKLQCLGRCGPSCRILAAEAAALPQTCIVAGRLQTS